MYQAIIFQQKLSNSFCFFNLKLNQPLLQAYASFLTKTNANLYKRIMWKNKLYVHQFWFFSTFHRMLGSISSSSSSSLTTSGLSSVFSLSSLGSLNSFGPVFSSLGSFLFALGPWFLSKEFALNVLEWGLVSWGLSLFLSWLSGQDNLNNCKESFLFNFDKSLFKWHEDINNFLLIDGGDLVEIGYFSFENLSNPECFFDKSFGGSDGDGSFILAEEKGQTSSDISTWE